MERAVSLLGVFAFIGLGYLFSDNKKRVVWKLIFWATIMQFVFALLVLKTKPGNWFFDGVRLLIDRLLSYTAKGSSFVFHPLTDMEKYGFIFAFQVLPTIIFFSSLMSVLYYLGVMQKVVEVIAAVMLRFLGTSGAETLCTSANIFLGQTEAPLLIKPYVEKLTRSELMTVMTGGFATIAGGVLGVYAGMLDDVFPDAAGHLLAASVMSAPAAILFAKLMIPETEEPVTHGRIKVENTRTEANVIDAAAAGASQGLMLALNVGAMLIAFIALVHMIDGILSVIGGVFSHPEFGLDDIFNVVFVPFAWLMGVPWGVQANQCAELLGQKLVINEFYAYTSLTTAISDPNCQMSGRTIMITIYALCGFTNFSSIGIQIAGIGGLAPIRRSDMARLGMAALLAGSLACFQTAAIAGVLVGEGEVVYNKPAAIQAPVHPDPKGTPSASPSPQASVSAEPSPSPSSEASPTAVEPSASPSP